MGLTKTEIFTPKQNKLAIMMKAISQHLKELKNAGLIKGAIEGASICYCIEAHTWAQYKKEFDLFFVAYTPKSCDC